MHNLEGNTKEQTKEKKSDKVESEKKKGKAKMPKGSKQTSKSNKKKRKLEKGGRRIHNSDEESEEWKDPSKRRRLGGSVRNRRMVTNNQTVQSAYMCL